MKLNLVWGTGPEYGIDYLTINPFVQQENEHIKRGDVCNLDNMVDNGELQELIAYDVIDYVDKSRVIPTIQHWLGKIAHGGKVVIGGVDMYEVSRGLTRYELDVIQANELLHGAGDKPYMLKRTNFTILGICDVLTSCNFKIIKRNLDGYKFVVEAVRQ